MWSQSYELSNFGFKMPKNQRKLKNIEKIIRWIACLSLKRIRIDYRKRKTRKNKTNRDRKLLIKIIAFIRQRDIS